MHFVTTAISRAFIHADNGSDVDFYKCFFTKSALSTTMKHINRALLWEVIADIAFSVSDRAFHAGSSFFGLKADPLSRT